MPRHSLADSVDRTIDPSRDVGFAGIIYNVIRAWMVGVHLQAGLFVTHLYDCPFNESTSTLCLKSGISP
jgi:hypothetical protein